MGSLIGTGDHGFSAFIETEDGNYLFDTVYGFSIIRNPFVLKKDLTTIKKISLSHGHSDHTGDLPEVSRLRGEVEVLAHPQIFAERIAVTKENDGEKRRFVGIPYRRDYLEFSGARFDLKREFYELEDGMFLTGEIVRETSFEESDPRLLAKEDGKWIPDEFLDDQSLVLDTPEGLVIMSGCSHSGMINTINHGMEKTGNEKLYALLGGTHLQFLPPEQLEESIETIKGLNGEHIGVSHCTGMRASVRFAQEFGDRFFFGHVGSVFET